jgi:hypothetical protein
MITTLVQFQLPSAITLEEATRRFEASAPTIAWFDGPVIVDNSTGGTITKAA